MVLGAATAAAQAVPNRATAYLHPTDVTDARAIWVNPAGLAGLTMASVYLDLTVGQPGGRGRLRQLSAGFDSRGFAFSYQRDILDGGGRGHTYKVGLGGGNGPLAAGFGVALYRGDTKGTGWDLGLRYVPSRALRVGGAILNIGEPSVRGVKLPVTFVPGASFEPFGRLSEPRTRIVFFENSGMPPERSVWRTSAFPAPEESMKRWMFGIV